MSSSTSLTVQELKKALRERGLSERGLKKELAERLDAAREASREEGEEEEEKGKEEETTTANHRKRGTKRKSDEHEDGEEEEEEEKRRKKTTPPPPPPPPVLRRGRSRSKSVEPPPPSEEEVKKSNDAKKPPSSSSATLEKIDEEGGEEKKKNTTNNKAAAMKEKMQKAKELMKKQKALAEKMKMKKMEAAGAGAKTTTTTTTTTTSTSAAQHAIEKARETAARLAALQHQQKKNRTATEGKFEKTGPAPVLRVNEKGQEVDENGKVIVRAKDYTATTKVNEKQKMREAFLQAEREVAMEEMRRRGDAAGGKREQTTKEDMIDPEIAVKQKHNRKKPSLQVSRVYSRAHSFFFLLLSSFLVGHMQGTLSYQSYITVT